MADAKTVLQKYVSDMLALESHIFQAIDKQSKEHTDKPEMKTKFETFAQTTKNQEQQLQARLQELGGAANQPVKQGVAAVAGVAAGVIDKLRSEESSKDLRDDLTALNLSVVSYAMLHTTALALGDQQTADLAANNAKENAQFIEYIHGILPTVVIAELKENHDVSPNPQAAEETKKLVSQIWK